MTTAEKREQKKKELREMEENQLTDETRKLIKSLNKVSWEQYRELLNNKQIIPQCRLKSKKSIYYDKDQDLFLFFNPVLRKLFPCGKFAE